MTAPKRSRKRRYATLYANCAKCGKRFAHYAMSPDGWCPLCANPDLARECARIAKIEKHLFGEYGGEGRSSRQAAYERKQLKKVAKMPDRVMPLLAEAYLSDGYTPTANSGKRGGPQHGRD